MYHHDARDYNAAASEAARFARSKYEQMIETGRKNATALLNTIHEETPRDRVVAGTVLGFSYDAEGLIIDVGDGGQKLHKNARQQLAERAGVPNDYLTRLAESDAAWKKDLAVDILKRSYSNVGGRYLSRSVGPEVRAMLSSRYRRIDARPCIEMFLQETVGGFGAVPLDGVASDVRCSLKIALPMIFEPTPNEVMLYGLEFGNSDFGKGKAKISTFIDRIWCTNKATMREEFSAVHLGGELATEIEWSDKTMALDTERAISAMRDVVRAALEPGKVNQLMTAIALAHEQDVDMKSARTRLAKVLSKGEVEAVAESFEKDTSILLPEKKSTWRLSNAISLLAGKTEDKDRRLDLERLAGSVLEGKLTVGDVKEAA